MNSIIVATDLSERSRQAVRRAVLLAAAADAKLTVVHVVDESMPDAICKQLQIGAKTLLSEQIEEDVGGKNITADVEVIIGDAKGEIGRFAGQSDADLLVVGLHRRRAFLDQIRETTMEHLVRSSEMPVLLVASPAEDTYRRVLCGTALSDVCAKALHKVPLVAPEAELTLFHAHEISFGNEARRDYETWTAMHPLPPNLPSPIFVEGKPTDALEDMMKDASFDLLAIGGHTRKAAGRYILGKFASILIRNPPCDLLIAK